MAIPAVIDILGNWPGWATLDLEWNDELSLQGSGMVRVREIAPPLWTLQATSKLLKPSDYRKWKARLSTLENGAALWYGYDLSSRFPIAYPNGSWPTNGLFLGSEASIASVAADNKTVTLGDLPEGFVISEGDLFSFFYGTGPSLALHLVVEDAVADAGGVTSAFEVRPHVRPGYVLTIAPVAVKQPKCLMVIKPGSVQPQPSGISGWGSISFEGIQTFEAVP